MVDRSMIDLQIDSLSVAHHTSLKAAPSPPSPRPQGDMRAPRYGEPLAHHGSHKSHGPCAWYGAAKILGFARRKSRGGLEETVALT